MSYLELPGTAPRVLSDFVAPRTAAWIRAVLLIVGGAALVGISAQVSVPVPGTPVPVTGQTFAVLLVGASLGWQLAASSMVLYMAVGGLGMPWFSAGDSGWGGPTFGYVVGFIAAAGIVGALAGRRGDRTALRTVLTMTLGTLTIYAVGVPWLASAADMSVGTAFRLGARPFLVGDALKVLLAAGLLPGAWALVRRNNGRAT